MFSFRNVKSRGYMRGSKSFFQFLQNQILDRVYFFPGHIAVLTKGNSLRVFDAVPQHLDKEGDGIIDAKLPQEALGTIVSVIIDKRMELRLLTITKVLNPPLFIDCTHNTQLGSIAKHLGMESQRFYLVWKFFSDSQALLSLTLSKSNKKGLLGQSNTSINL
jgi:hypothetical protein